MEAGKKDERQDQESVLYLIWLQQGWTFVFFFILFYYFSPRLHTLLLFFRQIVESLSAFYPTVVNVALMSSTKSKLCR